MNPNVTSENADEVLASDAEVNAALEACSAELDRGAASLRFSDAARNVTRDRYARGFRKNLPKVGGFQAIEPAIRRVAFFLGTIAREIAQFHGASEISETHAAVARSLVENECRLTAARTPKGTEGLICNGLD